MSRWKETLEKMYALLPMYQRQGAPALKKSLDNILAFSEILGHPEKKFRSVHIAGTNGKGSVSHMIAAVLQQSGYKTGLYTSPHLKDFRERIRVNGKVIPKSFVQDFVHTHWAFLERRHLSFFELSVGMAFSYFAGQKVDIAVIETGLGGRLDSTNIITPLVSVITHIGYDHTAVLGNTLEDIAREKAGIIKSGTPVITGTIEESALKVIRQKAQSVNAPVYSARNASSRTLHTDLKGIYQKENIQTAYTALQVLKKMMPGITEEHIYSGLQRVQSLTGLRGRWEVLETDPLVICDTAHNEDGIRYAVEQLKEFGDRTLHLILGFTSDKDAAKLLQMFPPRATYYFTQAKVPRAYPSEELLAVGTSLGLKAKFYRTVWGALRSAKYYAAADDVIFIGGSIFVVAEAL